MYRDSRPAVVLPEALSDESAAQLLELLYAIARAVEEHYAAQLHRYHHRGDERQHDLWADHDPPF